MSTAALRTAPMAVDHDPFSGPQLDKVVATNLTQRGMWFAARARPQAWHGHHVSLSWQVPGGARHALLRQALASLVARFDQLRAVISADGAYLMVRTEATVPLLVSRLPAQEAACQEALRHAAEAPFDLINGSLVRLVLLEGDAGDDYVVLAMHRIVGQDEAIQRIGQALNEAYRQLAGFAELPWRLMDALRTETAGGLAAIAIRSGGSERPLFLVHDGDGNHSYAWALAPFLDQRIPVYALPGVGMDEAPLRTAQGHASRLRGMIYAVQPCGPYRLAGFCDGGVIAYELALQLQGDNHEVEFLGMFNTLYFPLQAQAIANVDCGSVLRGAAIAGAARSGRGEAAHVQLERLFAAETRKDLPELMQALRDAGLMPDDLVDLTPAQAERSLDRARALLCATEYGYATYPISIPIHYFLAAADIPDQPLRGWDAVLEPAQLNVLPVAASQDDMLRRPHVEQVASTLARELAMAAGRRSLEAGYSPLVPLQAGRDGMPAMFCVPGAGANVVSFYELLDGLDPSWPVYGMQPRGLDGTLAPHISVEANAACYLRAIAEVQPEGPVHLLGHSFGGWVVYEIARELQKVGRQVATLTLIDTEPPQPEAAEYSHTEVLLHLIDIFEQMAERTFALDAAQLEQCTEEQQRALLHRCLAQAGLLPARSTPAMLIGPIRSFAACLRTGYTPASAYRGSMHLVLLDDPRKDVAERERLYALRLQGWRAYNPDVVSLRGPGNHMTGLKRPHITTIANWLRDSWKTATA